MSSEGEQGVKEGWAASDGTDDSDNESTADDDDPEAAEELEVEAMALETAP